MLHISAHKCIVKRPSHGGNTGSNPVGDASKINILERNRPAEWGGIRQIYGKDAPG